MSGATLAYATILYAGVNEVCIFPFSLVLNEDTSVDVDGCLRIQSGGEFGSNVLPGEFGVQYDFTNNVSSPSSPSLSLNSY